MTQGRRDGGDRIAGISPLPALSQAFIKRIAALGGLRLLMTQGQNIGQTGMSTPPSKIFCVIGRIPAVEPWVTRNDGISGLYKMATA